MITRRGSSPPLAAEAAAGPPGFVRVIAPAAPSIGISLSEYPVRGVDEIERPIAELAHHPQMGPIVTPDIVTNAFRGAIAQAAAEHLVVSVYPLRWFATSGGLVSYGPDVIGGWRKAVSYVDRILKGAKPGDLPVQAPTNFELVLNLTIARTLGIAFPRSLLARANEAIK